MQSASDDVMVDVERWVKEHQGALRDVGVSAKAVPANALHAARTKSVQSIQLERKGDMAEVVVWQSGECEVLHGHDPREIRVEQRSVLTQDDLETVMTELLAQWGP